MHIIKIIAIIALVEICIFLPYIPGEYDALAPTLSFMAQLFTFASLVFIPIGIAWFLFNFIGKSKKQNRLSNTDYYFAGVALVVLSLVVALVLITVFVSNNRALSLMALAWFVFFVVKTLPEIKKLRNTNNGIFHPVPLYLIVIPVLLISIRFLFINNAMVYARNLAIKQSGQLRDDIETYYQKNGKYPVSMLSVWKDYKTGVTGIKQYHYEPNGQAYNLYFENVSANIASKEIVMYNKLDEQIMTSHDSDLLLLESGELDQQRGYFKVNDLPILHWKCFFFD